MRSNVLLRLSFRRQRIRNAKTYVQISARTTGLIFIQADVDECKKTQQGVVRQIKNLIAVVCYCMIIVVCK